ncbi:MAG: dihydrofolate reductase family protein [Methylococcales bacterium]
MTTKKILRLLPAPSEKIGLQGLYLGHQLHQLGATQKPFVYANFLSSIDGRIALTDPQTGLSATPENLTSSEDFRLFQELQAQADCLITHGGYLRSLAKGRLGNILQVGLRADAMDLSVWRELNGMAAQPDLVIASASLDFPMPESLVQYRQQVLIATGSQADPQRVHNWQQQGYQVVIAGDKMVDGGLLVELLSQRSYKSLYLIAGPQMLATMIRNRKLQRLYLTTNHQLLGSEHFHTLIPGPVLQDGEQFRLVEHYYDTQSSNGHGQFYSCYELPLQTPESMIPA